MKYFFERYARLMIEEYEEDPTFTLSAGVQRVVWSGCMIPKVNLLSYSSLEFFHGNRPRTDLHESTVPY